MVSKHGAYEKFADFLVVVNKYQQNNNKKTATIHRMDLSVEPPPPLPFQKFVLSTALNLDMFITI